MVRVTFNEPRFSSRYVRRFVPGMGMISFPCANTQANANCAGEHFKPAAMSSSLARNFLFSLRLSV